MSFFALLGKIYEFSLWNKSYFRNFICPAYTFEAKTSMAINRSPHLNWSGSHAEILARSSVIARAKSLIDFSVDVLSRVGFSGVFVVVIFFAVHVLSSPIALEMKYANGNLFTSIRDAHFLFLVARFPVREWGGNRCFFWLRARFSRRWLALRRSISSSGRAIARSTGAFFAFVHFRENLSAFWA